MTKKITKEVLYTELKILQAKVDKLTDLLQENKPTPTESKPIFGTTARCLVCGKYDCPASYTNLPCPKLTCTNMQFTERLSDPDPEE